MQDRYAGDVGDFGKIGLLKCLQTHGFKIGVNWYVVQEITFLKGTIRDYFAIPACKEHYEMFHDAFEDMKKSKWGELGVCRLFPEWADVIRTKNLTYDEHIFLDVDSEQFHEGCSFEDYKRNIIRYLMLCGYNYSEQSAISLVNHYMDDIKKSYGEKEPVADLATDIGYGCG